MEEGWKLVKEGMQSKVCGVLFLNGVLYDKQHFTRIKCFHPPCVPPRSPHEPPNAFQPFLLMAKPLPARPAPVAVDAVDGHNSSSLSPGVRSPGRVSAWKRGAQSMIQSTTTDTMALPNALRRWSTQSGLARYVPGRMRHHCLSQRCH